MGKDILSEGKYWQQVYKELGGCYICSERGEILKGTVKQEFSLIDLVVVLFAIVILFLIAVLSVIWVGFCLLGATLMNGRGSDFVWAAFIGPIFINIVLTVVFILFYNLILKLRNKKNHKYSTKKGVPINSPEGKELLKQYYPEQYKIVEKL